MTRRKRLLALSLPLLALAVVVIAIPVGRHERTRADAEQVARIRAVHAQVGDPLRQPSLAAYRADPGFLCLFYARGERYFALEECFDPQGRVIETVDRSGSAAIYGSVAYRPELAPARISIAAATALLLRHQVPAKLIAAAGFPTG